MLNNNSASVLSDRQCRNCLFTPDKPGQFTVPAVFRRSWSMQNNTAFSWGVVKSSPRIWIWKYHVLSGVQDWISKDLQFSYLYAQYFEAFRTWKGVLAKLNVNLWKIWWKFKNRQNDSYPPCFPGYTEFRPSPLHPTSSSLPGKHASSGNTINQTDTFIDVNAILI